MGEARSNTRLAGVSLPTWLCARHVPVAPQLCPALPPPLGQFPMGSSPKGVKKSAECPGELPSAYSTRTAPPSCTDHFPPLITFLPPAFSFKPKHPLAPILGDFSFCFSALCLGKDPLHFAVSAIQELTQASTPQISLSCSAPPPQPRSVIFFVFELFS